MTIAVLGQDSESQWGDLEQRPAEWEGWMLLLCLAVQDGDSGMCLNTDSVSSLGPHQKVGTVY